MTYNQLEKFLQQPGINIAGICKEADITEQYLKRCRNNKTLPGEKVMLKLLPVIKRYGFKVSPDAQNRPESAHAK